MTMSKQIDVKVIKPQNKHGQRRTLKCPNALTDKDSCRSFRRDIMFVELGSSIALSPREKADKASSSKLPVVWRWN